MAKGSLTIREMRGPAFAFVGLFALALLQISSASHHFEHVADDFSKVCRICVQYKRLDDVAPVTPASVEIVAEFAAPTIVAAEELTPRVASDHRPRGPPLS